MNGKANDEFYTKLEDIQKELDCYDFSDKVVYCPADDDNSEFVNYFKNYNKPKDLIYTSDNILGHQFMYELADIVITNPPFSLNKLFYPMLDRLKKKYYCICPVIMFKQTFILDGGYYRGGNHKINKFKNNVQAPCFWITNLDEDRKPFIPEKEKTEYRSIERFNIVDRINQIGKDYKSIPNLFAPLTAFQKNFEMAEPVIISPKTNYIYLYRRKFQTKFPIADNTFSRCLISYLDFQLS